MIFLISPLFFTCFFASMDKEHLPIKRSTLNPFYTGGLFHCYMLDESICHFRVVGSILSLSFYF